MLLPPLVMPIICVGERLSGCCNSGGKPSVGFDPRWLLSAVLRIEAPFEAAWLSARSNVSGLWLSRSLAQGKSLAAEITRARCRELCNEICPFSSLPEMDDLDWRVDPPPVGWLLDASLRFRAGRETGKPFDCRSFRCRSAAAAAASLRTRWPSVRWEHRSTPLPY